MAVLAAGFARGDAAQATAPGWLDGGFWFILLGGILGAVTESVGIVQPWRPLLVAGGLAAVFVPLIRGAVLETRQLRAEGIELPGYRATRTSVISNAVLAGILWVLLAVAVAIGMPVFPLLPIAATIRLAYLIRRWRAEGHR